MDIYGCQSRLVCASRPDRTSFAPETTQPKRNDRGRIETRQQNQRTRSLSHVVDLRWLAELLSLPAALPGLSDLYAPARRS